MNTRFIRCLRITLENEYYVFICHASGRLQSGLCMISFFEIHQMTYDKFPARAGVPQITMDGMQPRQVYRSSTCKVSMTNEVLGEKNSLTGVPNPVTASQPTSAGKPVPLHPMDDPIVMSVNALYAPP